MLTRRLRSSAAAAARVLVTLQVPSSAQAPDPVTAAQCPRRPFETDLDWGNRCYIEEQRRIQGDTDRRVRMAEQQTAETARQRAILEKQPPLPASGNRLLGRWETATRPRAGGDPFAQLAAMLTGCGVLLGDGIVEFEPTRWAVYDSDGRNDMGAIEYRAGTAGVVFGVPAKGSVFQLLPFEFETPDRINLVGVVCTLARTKATVSGAAPAGRATAPAARGASATSAVPAAAAPGAAAGRSRLERFRGRMGYDCPDGVDVALESCTSDADDAKCLIVRVDQPPKDGVEVTFSETRAALVKRIASCKMRPLMVLDGKLDFAP